MVCFSLLHPQSRFSLSQIKSRSGTRRSRVSVPVSAPSARVFFATVSSVAVTAFRMMSLLFFVWAVQPEMVTASPALNCFVRSPQPLTVSFSAVKVPPVPLIFAPRGFTVLLFRSR